MHALVPIETKILVPWPDQPGYIAEINGVAKNFDCSIIHAQPDPEVRRISNELDLLELD